MKWIASWHNQQNGMCAQRRLRSAGASAQSDQSSLSAWRKLGSLATYPLSAQRRLWSDWANAPADLSLCWVHSYFVVLSWGRFLYLRFVNRFIGVDVLFVWLLHDLHIVSYICWHVWNEDEWKSVVYYHKIRLFSTFRIIVSVKRFEVILLTTGYVIKDDTQMLPHCIVTWSSTRPVHRVVREVRTLPIISMQSVRFQNLSLHPSVRP